MLISEFLIYNYPTSWIDRITFEDLSDTVKSDTIKIIFQETTAEVINPLAFEGVNISKKGANVIVNATAETRDIVYTLSGSTTNGMFKIYSEKRFNLLLNNVNITNSDGSAINIQAKKKARVHLINGTNNYLSDGSLLKLNDGYVLINASGVDGLDSNGDIEINSGTVVVHEPQSSPEVGMDYNGTCNVSGGFHVISGTNSRMTQASGASSSQNSVKITTSTVISANTLFHIQNEGGNNLLTFKPTRNYYSIVFSSNELVDGETYSVYTGGTSTGTEKDGLYTGGEYTGGTLKTSFTVSSSSTQTNATF